MPRGGEELWHIQRHFLDSAYAAFVVKFVVAGALHVETLASYTLLLARYRFWSTSSAGRNHPTIINPRVSASLGADSFSCRQRHLFRPPQGQPESEQLHTAACVALTAIAFALRFYKINHPDQVV